jgi:hypothetical protein
VAQATFRPVRHPVAGAPVLSRRTYPDINPSKKNPYFEYLAIFQWAIAGRRLINDASKITSQKTGSLSENNKTAASERPVVSP